MILENKTSYSGTSTIRFTSKTKTSRTMYSEKPPQPYSNVSTLMD